MEDLHRLNELHQLTKHGNSCFTKNKAVYTATPVAGGWAGAVMSWAGAGNGEQFFLDANGYMDGRRDPHIEMRGRTPLP